jgi:CheY-like chemotaxis protein
MTDWRVLVVDDEPANLEIIGEFLSGQPFALDFAGDGEAALARIARAAPPFDAILLDRMMPGMDGIEVLRRLKADPRYALTPVIIQTAAAAPEQVRQGLAAGAYYYLTKPYRPEALLGIVWAALEDFERERSISEAVERTTKSAAMAGSEYAFQTIEEAERLAVLLAAQCPVPQAVAMGLAELLVNAVEHGNLGISYAEKLRLKREDRWREEVERRQALPEYGDRRATVRMDRHGAEVRFTVSDQGHGFDWRRYLDFDPGRAFDPNGRGIALARQLAFARIEYRGCGNVVVATVRP